MQTQDHQNIGCDGDCHSCGGWAALGSLSGSDTPSGWRLAGGALAVFILPVVLAVTGAGLLRHHPGFQALGALAGLALGTLCVSTVMRKIPSKGRNSP